MSNGNLFKAVNEVNEYFKLLSRDKVNKPLPFNTFLRRLRIRLDVNEKKFLIKHYNGLKNVLIAKRKRKVRR